MKKIFLFVSLSLLFISCHRLGTGLLLWSPNESQIATGSVVNVLSMSRIRQTYTIRTPKTKKIELPSWRVLLSDSRKESQEQARLYEPFVTMFAISQRRGLPIRAERKSNSKQIYRLELGQVLKVLDRDEESSQEGRFAGHWTKVLTKDGTGGYVFDYYLDIYNESSAGEKTYISQTNTTGALSYGQLLVETNWRPKEIKQLLASNSTHFQASSLNQGFFIDQKAKTIKIQTPSIHYLTVYTEMLQRNENQFIFTDSSVVVTFQRNDTIEVAWVENGEEKKAEFVSSPREDETLAMNEIDRMNSLFANIYQLGQTFTSRAYSVLHLDYNKNFVWDDVSNLIAQQLITREAGNQGKINFPLKVGTRISNLYHGVISFYFQNKQTLHFLYKLNGTAMDLLYIPPHFIKEGTISTDQFLDPIRIRFQS